MKLVFVGLVFLKLVVSKISIDERRNNYLKEETKALTKIIDCIEARLNGVADNLENSLNDDDLLDESEYPFSQMSYDELKEYLHDLVAEVEFECEIDDSKEVADEVLNEYRIQVKRASDLAGKFPQNRCTKGNCYSEASLPNEVESF